MMSRHILYVGLALLSVTCTRAAELAVRLQNPPEHGVVVFELFDSMNAFGDFRDPVRSERMPLDACQFFYDCDGCGAGLRPNPGDCCVFCSFGTVKCPPVQSGHDCC